jgi:hypothetical protein
MSTSLGHGKSDSSPVLARVLTAHGGLENWERVRSLRADVVFGRSGSHRITMEVPGTYPGRRLPNGSRP